MSIYMSDAEYREFCKTRDKKKLAEFKALPLKELQDLVFYAQSFVDGQLEHGMYDYNDMYGPAGHVRDLQLKKQALAELVQNK